MRWCVRGAHHLHFGQDIPHNLPILDLSIVRELGPQEAVVKVIFCLIVLWQAQEVAGLRAHQILGARVAHVHSSGGDRAPGGS